MPTRRMNRSQARQYTRSTRCISPGDPGCGPKLKLRGDRWTKRDQRELDEYAEKKAIQRLPSIAKREYIREKPTAPGKPSGYKKQESMWEKENVSSGQKMAKKGVNIKKAIKMKKAQTGTKFDQKWGYGKTKTVLKSPDKKWKDVKIETFGPKGSTTKEKRVKTLYGKITGTKGKNGLSSKKKK